MAAGVTDRLWSVEDLVALWESYEQQRAERAAQMSQWEYRIEFVDLYAARHNPKPEIILMLNTLGAEGWEAVTSWGSGDRSYILFKRPISK
jgi:hypothetical protein